MKIADYLLASSLTDDAFAKRINRSRSFVTRLRQGTAGPSAETAMAIEKETGGQVRLADMLPERKSEPANSSV